MLHVQQANCFRFFADWANLTKQICQQILGVDARTYLNGVQVCKTWHVHRLDIRPKHIEYFGWAVQDEMEDMERLALALGDIVWQGRPNLSSLMLDIGMVGNAEEAMQRIYSVTSAARFPFLVKLDITLAYLTDWTLLNELPNSLKELSFGTLVGGAYDDIDGTTCGELYLHDLPHLEKIQLTFESDEEESIRIYHDLSLPSLQHVVHFSSNDDFVIQPVTFVDLGPDSFADSCVVVCNLNVSYSRCDMSHHVWTLVDHGDVLRLFKDDDEDIYNISAAMVLKHLPF